MVVAVFVVSNGLSECLGCMHSISPHVQEIMWALFGGYCARVGGWVDDVCVCVCVYVRSMFVWRSKC